jgi:hypothetical protein
MFAGHRQNCDKISTSLIYLLTQINGSSQLYRENVQILDLSRAMLRPGILQMDANLSSIRAKSLKKMYFVKHECLRLRSNAGIMTNQEQSSKTVSSLCAAH